MTTIRLGFSPDSDDLFMFYPVLHGLVPTGAYRFEHVRMDTQALNDRAHAADLDVVAVSIATYPHIAREYLLLPHGGSVGRGYGPVLVAPHPEPLSMFSGRRIAVPGPGTTAYLVLRLLLGDFVPVFLPITPYDRVFAALRAGEVDAALLIHEGRLTYERDGFARVIELGEAWGSMTDGLPLPLGGNVIQRKLGGQVIADVSQILREGIRYALAHKNELTAELVKAETRPEIGLDRTMLDRYLEMYANRDTLEYTDDARHAVEELFRRGAAAGLLPRDFSGVSWSP